MQDKINKIILAGNLNKHYFIAQNWIPELKAVCNKLICFDYRKINLFYGQGKMNEDFLKIVKEEKPNYIFLFLFRDEFYLDTLFKIKELSPQTKTLGWFGDDDLLLESFTIYFRFFLDYFLPFPQRSESIYKRFGIQKVRHTIGASCKAFKPLNIKKEYDVTFIGEPKADRKDLIKYLLDNGINIKIYGRGWDKYPEFKRHYGGIVSNEEYLEVINKSKINLAFSKNALGKLHYKGRFFEISACKSFALLEYFKGYLDFFENNKEIVMFKNKKDLLKKINYYLKNEKERERIANSAYKRIVKEYSLEVELKGIFKRISKEKVELKAKELPTLKKRAILLSEKDLFLNVDIIKDKIKEYDYIHILAHDAILSKYKEYLQVYSLEKRKKEVSCCEYYVTSKSLGNYLLFQPSTEIINSKSERKEFSKLLHISQFMFTKEYFLRNLNNIKAMLVKQFSFIDLKKTAIIFLPLLQVTNIRKASYNVMKKSFHMKFLYSIYSLKHRSKSFCINYLISLFLELFKGNTFIIKAIYDALKDKGKMSKVKEIVE